MVHRAPPDGPHAIDRLVGRRIRRRRAELGLSQEGLSRLTGLSRQQIQRFETASNRATVSMLFELARAMNVSPDYFFQDGCGMQAQPPKADPVAMAEAKEILGLLPLLKGRDKRLILDLIRGLGTPHQS